MLLKAEHRMDNGLQFEEIRRPKSSTDVRSARRIGAYPMHGHAKAEGCMEGSHTNIGSDTRYIARWARRSQPMTNMTQWQDQGRWEAKGTDISLQQRCRR
jgi:hypothetical protein